MDLATEFQKIYDSEINVRVSWLWAGGIEVWIGDDMNGYLAQDTVSSADEIAPWFQEAIAHFHPESTYAQALPEDVRERARRRLFMAPQAGAQVRCPHCGALPGMTELIGFTCQHCGTAVNVDPPKAQ